MVGNYCFEILENLLYLLYINEFFHLGCYNETEIAHYTYRGITGYSFHIEDVVKSLSIVFILANSADQDDMAHSVSLHLGLHPQRTCLWLSSIQRCYLLFAKGIILKFCLCIKEPNQN